MVVWGGWQDEGEEDSEAMGGDEEPTDPEERKLYVLRRKKEEKELKKQRAFGRRLQALRLDVRAAPERERRERRAESG